MINRRTFSLLGLGSLSGLAQSNATQTIRVVSSPYLGSAPLYLAQENGYFEKEGLKVEIVEAEGSRASIPLLAAGKADVSMGSIAPQVFNAISRGARLRMVASRSTFTKACPDQRRVYGSKQAFPNGFHDLRQMKGKRVAYDERLSILPYALAKGLKSAGMTKEDFTPVNLQDREASAMLLAGKVDVCFGAPSTILFSGMAERVVAGPSFSSFLPNFTHAYLLYGKRILDESPSEGTRFLRVMLRANREYVAGKDPAWVKEFAKEHGYSDEHLKLRCRAEIDPNGTMNETEMQDYIDWGVREGLISAPIKAGDCLDTRFLREVKRG